jgi:rhodanese-related sulfurtransferase
VAEPARVDQLLAEARRRIDRVTPADLADEISAGAIVVDLRPQADRDADGPIPGAVAIEMIHLLWRLDPTSPDRLAQVEPDSRVVLVCNEGYASSIAAASLLDLGLEGGARAWHRQFGRSRPGPEGAGRWGVSLARAAGTPTRRAARAGR